MSPPAENRADALLVVMAKAPRPGEVKTRLVPPLTSELAARLHECCLLDTLEKASRLLAVDYALAYAPVDAGPDFERLWPEDCLRFPQEGEGLGERMLNALRRAFAEGYAFAALHGTDIPQARPGELVRGFAHLRGGRADLVLGPSRDGGYYFIAAGRAEPELFRGIEWSAESVFASTRSRALSLGFRVSEIAPARDLDTPEDLSEIRAELERTPERTAPRTRRFLEGERMKNQ